ncbi:hypothetical protein QRD02_07105 [Aequorivita sp. SDUM287046]|uniref:General stress protein CsbD n=1 Tax=Aequorivita aurantiaca TaxID=3053356 RepID=A0ABT8DLY6_9FLAO|nr:hypothetical protein [Aequorivita aurantiaca]MDN3724145.1 hypothetical protein [Aequorivita aurantiaca]
MENDNLQNLNRNAENDLETKWNDIAPSYRKMYPSITEQDVDYREGEFDSMTDRIAKRTNRRREDVLSEIRDWEMGSNY